MRHIVCSARVLQPLILAALLLAGPAQADDAQPQPITPVAPAAAEIDAAAAIAIPAEPPAPGPF